MKLRTLTAAILVAASGGAYAAIAKPSTGNGELFLYMDAANLGQVVTYTLDLGIGINDFNPNQNQSFALTVGTTALGNAVGLTGNPAGFNAEDWVFGVYGASQSGSTVRQVMNGPLISVPIAGIDLGNLVLGFDNALGPNSNTTLDRLNEGGTHATQANGAFLATTPPITGPNFEFFSSAYTGGGVVSLNEALQTAILTGNSTTFDEATVSILPGTWTLSLTAAGGTLSYSVAAVPVPAAAWLFGSAMAGMIGISRRRKG